MVNHKNLGTTFPTNLSWTDPDNRLKQNEEIHYEKRTTHFKNITAASVIAASTLLPLQTVFAEESLHLQRQSLKRQPQLLRLSLSLHRQHLLQLKTCQQPLWSGSHVERRRHGV